MSVQERFDRQQQEFTGFDSSGNFVGFYVGGVPTKPMKPQRLKKGGLAKPKVKSKRMKKGGLASKKKISSQYVGYLTPHLTWHTVSPNER